MKTIAQDIMTTEVLAVREGATLDEALKLLFKHRITGLPVVNAKGQLVGVVSEFDIMAQITNMPDVDQAELNIPFRFTREVRSILPSTELKEIIDILIEMKARRLPVVDRKKKLVGIVTRRDLIRLFYYRARLT